jgi:murein DD-endopeptidase MepM/ murein hydrolase activator NlpD
MIKEHDSIIYQSIFDINQEPRKQMGLEFDDTSPNFYMSVVQETNNRISILNDKMAKELYQLDGLVDLAHSHQEMLLHIPAIQPIENKNLKRIASGWGMRIHPIYGIPKFHYGLDFTAPLGTPVYATGDGVVQIIIKDSDKRSQGYGNLIIIDHGYGYKTLYSHLQKFESKPGEKVTRGEIIAYVGSTGLSTGPHLHYEVIKDNKKVDPIYYLFGSLTPEEYQKVIELSNRIQKAYD